MLKFSGKSFLTAVTAGAVLSIGSLPVHAQSNTVQFATEGDTTEIQSLPGHTCNSQNLLESVTLTFNARAIDSEIPGTSIRGLGVENEDPVSGGEIQSCNELVNLSLSVVGGPSDAGLSVSNPPVCLTRTLPAYDGVSDYGGTSGASLPNATNVNVTDTVTITGANTALFTSAGFDVRFVFDARGLGSNETADASFANGLDGSGSVSVSYTCGVEMCAYDPTLPADDPGCFERCEYDPTLPADDPNCLPPRPVPGISMAGLVAALAGLPLIAGFFARRRR